MKITKITFAAALLTCIAACSEDESVNKNIQSYDGETTPVQFEMNANTGNFYSPISRSVNLPEITKDNFRIMAFKKAPANGKYFYAQDISTTGMNFTDKLLSGTCLLYTSDAADEL